MQTKNWMALLGLTCAAFIFNTSEFIPIGLLTDIANDFLTTEAQAGMIISIYAFVVMLLSLPLMIVVSRFEMKKLLSSVIFVFVGFQLLSKLLHADVIKNRRGVCSRYILVYCFATGRKNCAGEI